MICPNDITSLKTDINEMIGQKIMIKGSLGRCRTFEKEATIEKTYPNIFVIKSGRKIEKIIIEEYVMNLLDFMPKQ